MQFHIYCNEKNIDHNHSLATDEYIKRLSPYCSVNLHVGKKLLFQRDTIKKGHLLIIIKTMPSDFSSVELSKYIKDIQLNGTSTVHIFIGFSEEEIYTGISESLSDITIHRLSISPFSIENQTSLIILLEQLYRGYTIIHGKTYHK